MRQAAAIFGRAVMTTLPLISALALRFLMFTLPICLATLAPSRLPSASPTAPVAFADSDPVTLSVPVSGVASDSTSCAPVAAIGPRWAVQPISAFCRICEIGFSALPLKVLRRAAIGGVADRRQRNRDRHHHNGAARRRRQRRQFDQHRAADRAARRQPVHRLQADHERDRDHRDPDQNCLQMHRQTHRPPGPIEPQPGSTGKGKGAPVRANWWPPCGLSLPARHIWAIANESGPGECRSRFVVLELWSA